jgi:hypothetical protein
MIYRAFCFKFLTEPPASRPGHLSLYGRVQFSRKVRLAEGLGAETSILIRPNGVRVPRDRAHTSRET